MIIFRQKPKSTQKFTIMFTIVSLLKKKWPFNKINMHVNL